MPKVDDAIAALKAKYKTPREALEAIRMGLDHALSRENLMKRPTKLAAASLLVIKRGVEPLLAMDAKVDLLPLVADLTTKNFSAKTVTAAVRKAIAGKTIAKDANLDHVEGGLSTLEKPHEAGLIEADESVSPEQHNAMEAAAHGHSTLGIPKDVGQEFAEADKGKTFDAVRGFLRDRGMSDDDIAHLEGMMPGNGVDRRPARDRRAALDMHHYHGARDESESEEEREKREKEAEDRCMSDDSVKGRDAKHHHHYADDKRSAKDKRPAKDKGMGKDEVDASIAAAVKAAREQERGIRVAFDKVRPYVGEMRPDMAFDSGADVIRAALEIKGVPNASEIHESALNTVLSYQTKLNEPAPRDPGRPRLALDHKGVPTVEDMFPEAKRIGRG